MSEVLTPEQVRPHYGAITRIYIKVFGEEPWSELTLCADPEVRCLGGLSPLAIGSMCDVCHRAPTEPAYTPEGLIAEFEEQGERGGQWYIEQEDNEVAFAMFAFVTNASELAGERYKNVDGMGMWLGDHFGEKPFLWLEAAFADTQLRPHGNLHNFGPALRQMAEAAGVSVVAYRTRQDSMVHVAQRDFPDCQTFDSSTALPDTRPFILIRLDENAEPGAS